MFLIENDYNLLYKSGFLKGDINFLHKEFNKILLELNEKYLDYVKNKKNLFWKSF